MGIHAYSLIALDSKHFGTEMMNLCFEHCVKSVQIRSFFWSVFSCIRTEYGDLRSKSKVTSKKSNIKKVKASKLSKTNFHNATFDWHRRRHSTGIVVDSVVDIVVDIRLAS